MIFQGILGMAAVFAGMFLNYVYHFFMVRELSPATYGDLSLVIGIMTILLVPTGSIGTIVTREVSKIHKDEGRVSEFLRAYARQVAFYSAAVSILFLFMAPLIGRLFSDNILVLPLQMISLSIPAAYVMSVIKSYFQGKERIGFLSGLMVAEPALRLVSALLLVYAGFGLIGASAAIAIAPAIIFATFGLYFFGKLKNSAVGVKHSIGSHKPLVFVLATNVLLMIFLYLDLFFVKYYLGSEDAGFYNVASITAKVLMFSVGGITLIFLPKASKLNMKENRPEIKTLLIKSVMLMLPVFLAFLVFPREIISLFYTAKYLSALASFRILTIGMFAYALFTILLNLAWSQNREKAPLLLSFAVLVLDAVLLYYMIPIYGLVGASLATTTSSVALLLAFGWAFLGKA